MSSCLVFSWSCLPSRLGNGLSSPFVCRCNCQAVAPSPDCLVHRFFFFSFLLSQTLYTSSHCHAHGWAQQMSPTLGLDLRQDGGVVPILLSLISRGTPLAGRCDVCCCCPLLLLLLVVLMLMLQVKTCSHLVQGLSRWRFYVITRHRWLFFYFFLFFCNQRVYNVRSCYLVTGEPTGDVQPSSVSRCRHSYKLRLVMINTVGGWLGGRAGAISTRRWQ